MLINNMKNIMYRSRSNNDHMIRMLVREIIKESIDIVNNDLEYASVTAGSLTSLASVQIQLPDTKLIITPIIQPLDEKGLNNIVGGANISNEARPLILLKLASKISMSQIALEIFANDVLLEKLSLKGSGAYFGDNLYNFNEIENLVVSLNGFVLVDQRGSIENSINQKMSLTNIVDPSDLAGGAAGYIVEFLFEEKKDIVKFTPGKVMPAPQNTYAAVHANPSAFDVKISPIGMRLHPIDKVWKMHYGQDISRLSARTLGQDIISVLPGVVIESKVGEGFGSTIVIKHDAHGNIATRYSHMQNISDKLVGSKVEIGEVIGNVGSTGKSTAPHLHFTVFNDASTYNDETTAGDPPAILANYPSAIFPITVKIPKK